MSYDITFRCDDTDSAIGLVTDVLDDNHDGRVRLITFTPTEPTHRRVDSARPVLTNLDIMRTVDCPHKGCPGRPGYWCGNAKGSNYGAGFMHQARKQAQR